MKFRKKPVEIEARQFTEESALDVLAWIRSDGRRKANLLGSPPALGIVTLEGEMRADLGDWIIRGVQGEFYPCKPDIFEETYDEVSA